MKLETEALGAAKKFAMLCPNSHVRRCSDTDMLGLVNGQFYVSRSQLSNSNVSVEQVQETKVARYFDWNSVLLPGVLRIRWCLTDKPVEGWPTSLLINGSRFGTQDNAPVNAIEASIDPHKRIARYSAGYNEMTRAEVAEQPCLPLLDTVHFERLSSSGLANYLDQRSASVINSQIDSARRLRGLR